MSGKLIFRGLVSTVSTKCHFCHRVARTYSALRATLLSNNLLSLLGTTPRKCLDEKDILYAIRWFDCTILDTINVLNLNQLTFRPVVFMKNTSVHMNISKYLRKVSTIIAQHLILKFSNNCWNYIGDILMRYVNSRDEKLLFLKIVELKKYNNKHINNFAI